jgi:hypothetical protein
MWFGSTSLVTKSKQLAESRSCWCSGAYVGSWRESERSNETKCLGSFLMVQCRWATYSMSCSQQELWNGMVENIAEVTLERNKIMVLIHSSTISMLNKILVAASIVFPLYIIELDILAPPGTYGRSKLMTKSKVSWDMSASSVHALWKSLLINQPSCQTRLMHSKLSTSTTQSQC